MFVWGIFSDRFVVKCANGGGGDRGEEIDLCLTFCTILLREPVQHSGRLRPF